MEILVLTTLQWRVSTPTAATFLEHLLRALSVRARVRRVLRAHARAVITRTQPEARFLCFAPSALACAAVHHALRSARQRGRPLTGCAERLDGGAAAAGCLAALESLGPAWTEKGFRACAPVAVSPSLVTPAAHGAHGRKPSFGERESPVSMLEADFDADEPSAAGAAGAVPAASDADDSRVAVLKRGLQLAPPGEWKRCRGGGGAGGGR